MPQLYKQIIAKAMGAAMLVTGIGATAGLTSLATDQLSATLTRHILGKDTPTVGKVNPKTEFVIRCDDKTYSGTNPEGLVTGGGFIIAVGDNAEETFRDFVADPLSNYSSPHGTVVFDSKDGKRVVVSGTNVSIAEKKPSIEGTDTSITWNDGTRLAVPGIDALQVVENKNTNTQGYLEGNPPNGFPAARMPVEMSFSGETKDHLKVIALKKRDFVATNFRINFPIHSLRPVAKAARTKGKTFDPAG